MTEDLSLEVELETEADEVELELEFEWAASTDEPAVAPADVPPAADGSDTDESRSPGTDDGPAGGEADGDGAADGTVDDADVDEPAAPEPLEPMLAGAADGSQSLARFEVFRDRADEWRWRLRHRNGNVIATSGEGYTRKHNAWKGLRSVMANAPEAEVRET